MNLTRRIPNYFQRLLQFCLLIYILKQLSGESEICPENGLLVLPNALVANIIGYFHVLHGHLGFERLSKIINSIYFSKNLSKNIKELTQSCHNCQMAKGDWLM